MRIGFDLDGPVHGFIERCNEIRMAQGESQFAIGKWHFYRDVGMTDADWVAWCNKAADEGHLFTAPPLPGAVESMRRVKEMGHTVVVATDRSFGSLPVVSEKLTHQFLETYFEGLYDEVHFGPDKTKYNLDMMVEDKWENFIDLLNVGTDAYLISKPWNAFGGVHRNRIADITEFADIVEDYTISNYIIEALANG